MVVVVVMVVVVMVMVVVVVVMVVVVMVVVMVVVAATNRSSFPSSVDCRRRVEVRCGSGGLGDVTVRVRQGGSGRLLLPLQNLLSNLCVHVVTYICVVGKGNSPLWCCVLNIYACMHAQTSSAVERAVAVYEQHSLDIRSCGECGQKTKKNAIKKPFVCEKLLGAGCLILAPRAVVLFLMLPSSEAMLSSSRRI